MKSIAKYQVIEELSAGASGITYHVRDGFRNRELAVKVLRTIPDLSAEAKQEFCGQLASVAELTHRQIAKVHDLGEVEEGIFVASEWRSGLDLRRFMQANRDLPLDQKLAVMAQVAEGLAFAHSRGVTHGDLKPSNIFVDAARDASILDFGVAKWLTALLHAGCRVEGLVANYLAPEQVLGQPFDERSDIFALGVLLYEAITGSHPFSTDPGLVPREIVHLEPQPLRALDPQIPQKLEELVARALTKSPEQRLQTAEEFASGLYLAAQQLRRVATAAPSDHSPAEQPAAEPGAYPPPDRSSAEPAKSEGVFQSASALQSPAESPSAASPSAALSATGPAPFSQAGEGSQPAGSQPEAFQFGVPATPPARERPQDAEPGARPWTARSYAAGKQSPPAAADLGRRPRSAGPGQNVPEPSSASQPAFEPPVSFLRPPEPVPEIPQLADLGGKSGSTTKRLLVAAVGLVIAVGIVGSLVSRQNLRASPDKRRGYATAPAAATAATSAAQSPAPAVSPVVSPPAPPVAALPEPRPVQPKRTPQPGESGPDDLGNPEFSARQTLNGPVRSLWESGRYSQAMALVNQVLAGNPDNEDARIWKKKIREAQAAEAALK
jgi:serine/threonine-protein kinase